MTYLNLGCAVLIALAQRELAIYRWAVVRLRALDAMSAPTRLP